MNEFIWSTEWDGSNRKLFPKKCQVCSTTKYIPKHISHRWKYCSKNCRGLARQNRVEVECAYCHEKFNLVASKVKMYNFCDRKCKEDCQTMGTISDILPAHYKSLDSRTSYRKRALRLNGSACASKDCEIKAAGIKIPKEMLDVDHIDGDRTNNKLENLQVLCVWCHRKKTVQNNWERK